MAVYLMDGVGLYRNNLEILHQIMALIRTIGLPFIILGDWNMTPTQLAGCTWLADIGAAIETPRDTEITCTAGNGSLIDYAVISISIKPLLECCEYIQHLPWGSHMGIRLKLSPELQHIKVRTLIQPWGLPTPKPEFEAHATWSDAKQYAGELLNEYSGRELGPIPEFIWQNPCIQDNWNNH